MPRNRRVVSAVVRVKFVSGLSVNPKALLTSFMRLRVEGELRGRKKRKKKKGKKTMTSWLS